jgi:hypothetical protein
MGRDRGLKAAHSPPRATLNGPSQPSDAVEYKDSVTDVAFVALCRVAFGRTAGWQSTRSWTDGPESFRGMVEVSRALMKVGGVGGWVKRGEESRKGLVALIVLHCTALDAFEWSTCPASSEQPEA